MIVKHTSVYFSGLLVLVEGEVHGFVLWGF